MTFSPLSHCDQSDSGSYEEVLQTLLTRRLSYLNKLHNRVPIKPDWSSEDPVHCHYNTLWACLSHGLGQGMHGLGIQPATGYHWNTGVKANKANAMDVQWTLSVEVSYRYTEKMQFWWLNGCSQGEVHLFWLCTDFTSISLNNISDYIRHTENIITSSQDHD